VSGLTPARPADDDDVGIAPAAIDLLLDGEGLNPIAMDSSGQNTRQHGRILGERGRKGNAVF